MAIREKNRLISAALNNQRRCVPSTRVDVSDVHELAGGYAVSLSRKEINGGKAFAAPLLGVVILVACYLVLAEWDRLPMLIGATLSAVHWPI